MARRLPAGVAAATLFGALVVAGPAHADKLTKTQCIDANTQAQSLRRDGKLGAARAQLAICDNPACPEIIRDDCTQRRDELERVQPTILFDAKDGDGKDLVAVSVTVDGAPLADSLAGKALRVDPGAHTFVFTVAGQTPVQKSLVLRESEKDRIEHVVIGTPTATAPPPTTTPAAAATPSALPATPPDAQPSGLGTQRILGIGLAGAGVIGLALGSVTGLMASSAWSNAKTACGGDVSHCTNPAAANDDKSTTNSLGMVSTVGFIAGGVLLAGGAALFFTGGHGDHAPGTASVSVTPAIAPGLGGMTVVGSF